MRIYDLEDEISFGKHCGLTLKEVLDKDEGYITWAIETIDDFDISEEAEEYWDGLRL